MITSVRKFLKLLLLMLPLFSIVVAVQSVKAPYTEDGQVFPLASGIVITSPSNVTYSSNLLTLGVTFQFLLGPRYANVSYSVDGKSNVTLPLTATQTPREVIRTYANGTTVMVNSTLFAPFKFTGGASLPELSDGPHNVTVYARYLANNIVGLDSSTVHFTVDAKSEQELPEFPLWTIFPILLVLTLAVITVRNKLRKNG